MLTNIDIRCRYCFSFNYHKCKRFESITNYKILSCKVNHIFDMFLQKTFLTCYSIKNWYILHISNPNPHLFKLKNKQLSYFWFRLLVYGLINLKEIIYFKQLNYTIRSAFSKEDHPVRANDSVSHDFGKILLKEIVIIYHVNIGMNNNISKTYKHVYSSGFWFDEQTFLLDHYFTHY